MTWWLSVRDPIEANFLSGVFLPLTCAEACEKSSRWLWKESCVRTGVRKPGNTCASPTAMIIMTLAVKVALNPNTTNQIQNDKFGLLKIHNGLQTTLENSTN